MTSKKLHYLVFYFTKMKEKNIAKIYLVHVVLEGKLQGIFSTWHMVLTQINGHKNAMYIGFYSFEEAYHEAKKIFGNCVLIDPIFLTSKVQEIYLRSSCSDKGKTPIKFVMMIVETSLP